MRLQSQTWSNLRQLLGELPKRRVRLFILVLLASLVQGLLDVFLVALLARLATLPMMSSSPVRSWRQSTRPRLLVRLASCTWTSTSQPRG